MVSVIIPALNEEKTIAKVIALAKQNTNVSEVIVVDDKSIDNTVQIAKNAGAIVITSTKLGKGTSMREGILIAKNEILAFLDADIETYTDDVILKLTKPILEDEADFVKSFFTRQAGRVTELVAKPLLSILNPNFPTFQQPLSGMIAGKKDLLLKCKFEEGYGVDIGLLMDIHSMGARITEVDIGNIENRMHQLRQLGKMSRDVAKTIMKKSVEKNYHNLNTYEDIQIIREQMDYAIKENLVLLKKMVILDMDNTLLRASFIQTAADKFNFKNSLIDIATAQYSPYIRTKQIASLLKGKSYADILAVADGITLSKNIASTIQSLRDRGFIIGLISDSYDCITNHFKNKFDLDFTLANELEFSEGIATGEVKVPSFFLQNEKSECKHDYCKLNAIISICNKYGIDLANTLVIGDGENDVCSIKKAGIGISFCSTYNLLDAVADYVIKEPDFNKVLELID